MSSPESHPMPPPPRRPGGGMCIVGCAVLALVILVSCGGLVWYLVTNIESLFVASIAGVTRAVAVNAIEQSELRDEDKQAIIAQIDRVVEEAKKGNLNREKVDKILTNLGESPLVQVGAAYFIQEAYVKPSGLPQEEKQQADRTLDRVARGMFEKKISRSELDSAKDLIRETGPDGERKFKDHLTDEELRTFLAKCKQLADDAGIPDEDFKVDIGAEVKKAVDKALGES